MMAPGLGEAVSGESALAVASLEVGAGRRAATIAMTRSRQRLPSGPRMRSRPILRRVPRTAATWPCGRARWMTNTSGEAGAGMTVPPLRRALEAVEEVRGPVGEVAEGSLLDLSAFAVGLAQQDGGGRASVRDGLDVHAHPGWHGPRDKASEK